MNKVCVVCGRDFKCKPSHAERRKTCGRDCGRFRRKEMYRGENNPNYGNRMEKCAAWKGGKRISNYGYVLLFLPDYPNARPDGYIFEHRYVMSEFLGRPLLREEHVHHKDGNKLNNAIGNLEITTLSEHTRRHNLGKTIIRDSVTGRIRGVINKEDAS